MNRIIIIHYSPLEEYPPVQNLIRELVTRIEKASVVILTTGTTKHITAFQVASPQIIIKRISRIDGSENRLRRFFHYLSFNLKALIYLLKFKPRTVLYYESLSSFPVYAYSKLFRKEVNVCIHYHEYASPSEYKSGMWLNNLFHRLERSMYSKAMWVSHTNKKRLEMLVKDVAPVVINNPYVLPNYPPKSWELRPKNFLTKPLEIVYVGALSLTTMYTREFVEWVISQNGTVNLTIYSNNFSNDAVAYIENLKTNWVRIKPGVSYDQIPGILREYSVGVILYKGHIPNYVYNAPNKLFEYLACGLDVWCPIEMVGCEPYLYSEAIPKVIKIDFNNIRTPDIMNSIDCDRNVIRPIDFFCENALAFLVAKLFVE